MTELQKKLKELVRKGELKEEEFEEISTKMEFVEEPEPEKPADPEPAKPEEQGPNPAEKVEPKEPEVNPEPEPEKPAAPVVPEAPKEGEEPVLPAEPEQPVPPVEPEKPAEPISDPRVDELVKRCEELKSMVEGYEARIKSMEDVIAKLGEPIKKEEKEFGNNPRQPEPEGTFANDTDAILNRPGMGGVHR